MSSQPYDPDAEWRSCFHARHIPHESLTNADMSGIAVGVTTVVVTFCLRIQIAWSRAYIDGAVISSLIQVYSVLLSALISINHQQLSLFDAHFALIITSSPLTIWLAFASICDLSGIETEFFKRIQSHRAIIRISGALILPIWIGLNLTISLSNQRFIDGNLCSDYTLKEQLMDPLLLLPILCCSLLPLLSLPPLSLPGLTPLLLLLAPFLLTVALMELHLSTLGITFPTKSLLVVNLIFAIWEVLVILIANPPWNGPSRDRVSKFDRMLAVLDFCWATTVITNSIIASGSKYVLSYGQLVALSAAVYPFMSTFKLGYDRRWDLFDFFCHLPERVRCAYVARFERGTDISV